MNRSSRPFALLLILFAGSGCSALIYEIAWYQLLQLAMGSTAVSLGFLLATYMGGLCIGSIWLPRSSFARRHPGRLFGLLEFGIAILALLVRGLIPLVDRVYIVGAEHGVPSMLLRGFISAVCLLPPTILMGASLPAMVRWIERDAVRSESQWAMLYGGNTLGAVFGCLLAGFYLLRIYDMTIATVAAAAINLTVALCRIRPRQRRRSFSHRHTPSQLRRSNQICWSTLWSDSPARARSAAKSCGRA